jgi:glucosamine--fructose-6-phosphate aminotransferase (isomerizing)
MCGILGYLGYQSASSVILKCLEKLEYRGYDSCGIAVLNGKQLFIQKDSVRVAELAKTMPPLTGNTGIGHTRWATCGEPSRINAHPHTDCQQKIAVVHNGIISNFQELRQILAGEGHVFLSETDTEVIPHLIEKYYNGNLGQAVACAIKDIEGSYAIAAIRAGENALVLARQGSPLVLGLSDNEYIAASNETPVLDFTDRVVHLEDGDICVITPGGIEISRNGLPVPVKEERVAWNALDTHHAGYPHYMLKEIHEQPRVITDTLAGISDPFNLSGYANNIEPGDLHSLLIIACGTSYHAALLGKYIFGELRAIPVNAEIASECIYSSRAMSSTTALAISQSGETADTLQAARIMKAAGCRLIGITNVMGSQLSRISDHTLYTKAGPEISVTATKTFMAQAVLLYYLALSHSRKDKITRDVMLTNLRQVPVAIGSLLQNAVNIKKIGNYLADFNNVLLIARGLNYPVALEGALKLKETAYIHAEGYAAGELKHGSFALLDARTPVVAIVAHDSTYNAMLTNIREIKARKTPVIAIAEEGDEKVADIVDNVIEIPAVDAFFSPLVNVVALQLLAYYTALDRKSVV